MRRRAPRRRLAPRRSLALTRDSQFAKIQETLNVGLCDINVAQKISIAGLGGFARAQAVARQFQLYRISKVELQIKPLYDTFIPAATPLVGPATVPEFYWSMIRDGDYPTTATNVYFERRGCKPIRMDDKIIKLSFRPNTLLQTAGAAFAPNNGSVKMTPWLSCDATQGVSWSPNLTTHYGMCILAVSALLNPAVSNPGYNLSMTIHYEFKKPHQQFDASGPAVRDVTPVGYQELFDASGNSLDNPAH